MEFFTTLEVQAEVLQLLYKRTWTTAIYSVVSACFQALAARQDMLADLVRYQDCGALSLLQVTV